MTGRISPALATRRWSSKAMWMRSGCSSGSIFWVLLVSGRFSISKTIIPEAKEHFLIPSAPRDTHPFGGFGLNRIVTAFWPCRRPDARSVFSGPLASGRTRTLTAGLPLPNHRSRVAAYRGRCLRHRPFGCIIVKLPQAGWAGKQPAGW